MHILVCLFKYPIEYGWNSTNLLAQILQHGVNIYHAQCQAEALVEEDDSQSFVKHS